MATAISEKFCVFARAVRKLGSSLNVPTFFFHFSGFFSTFFFSPGVEKCIYFLVLVVQPAGIVEFHLKHKKSTKTVWTWWCGTHIYQLACSSTHRQYSRFFSSDPFSLISFANCAFQTTKVYGKLAEFVFDEHRPFTWNLLLKKERNVVHFFYT